MVPRLPKWWGMKSSPRPTCLSLSSLPAAAEYEGAFARLSSPAQRAGVLGTLRAEQHRLLQRRLTEVARRLNHPLFPSGRPVEQ